MWRQSVICDSFAQVICGQVSYFVQQTLAEASDTTEMNIKLQMQKFQENHNHDATFIIFSLLFSHTWPGGTNTDGIRTVLIVACF